MKAKSELAATREAFRGRSRREWLAALRRVPEGPLRNKAAAIAWWDYRGVDDPHNPKKGMPALDAIRHLALGDIEPLPGEEELAGALVAIGYPAELAAKRAKTPNNRVTAEEEAP